MTFERIHIGEAYKIQSADGLAINFNADVFLQGYSSFGSPPISYETRQGYGQDGETVIDFKLDSLNIGLQLRIQTQPSRQDWWDFRARLLNIFRPNRGGALTLFVIQPENIRRAIDCYYVSGLNFDQEASASDYGINTQISLRAFTPLWYNPNIVNAELAGTDDESLVFPITFPITFGEEGLRFSTGELNYAGTWRTYPVLTIEGPYNTCRITNSATNGRVDLRVAIGSGEQRIVTLDPANLSIVDQDGNNTFDEMLVSSNLVDFVILPEGEYDNSLIQSISAALVGGVQGVSGFQVTYYERYFGI